MIYLAGEQHVPTLMAPRLAQIMSYFICLSGYCDNFALTKAKWWERLLWRNRVPKLDDL
jgi:hypothetical protein